jgi:hypothetical protein
VVVKILSFGSDLRIRHNGTNSRIDNYTGTLQIRNTLDDADITLETDDGSGGLTPYITLDGSTTDLLLSPPGNVGIGIGSPFAKLHINNGNAGVSALDFEDVSSCAIFVDAVQNTNYFQPLIGVGENATTFTAAISSYDAGGSAAQGLAFHTGNTNAITEAMRIDSNQNVGIGTQSPADLLHIADTVNSNFLVTMRAQNSLGYAEFGTQSNYARILSNGTLLYAGTSSQHFHYIGGSLAMTLNGNGLKIEEAIGVGVAASTTDGRGDFSNDVVAFSTSDKRLKENIKPLDNALEKVLKISGVSFDWKELTEEEKKTIHGNEGHDVGVIAQEIEEVLPEVVTERDSGYKAVKYEKIVPLLIEAIKEQQKQIEELKNG